MKALIVVDMLNDFVTGALANEAYVMKIVPVIKRLINYARCQPDWLVVYANDAHRADDREMSIWGRHAIAGTPGANVIEALAPVGADREIISPKRFYGAFDGTDLEEVFKAYGVTEVVLTGQHTHCCVRHTAYGAFIRGYQIKVLSDAVCVFSGVDQQAALDYLKTIYDVEITTSTALGV
ncbi:cysteine hydrolase family protein [Photorhabdus heterorhabditis]|uniref:cysteine hydrolase family protein n=1 Tax=Photorhabdus heterorhabditis TaxID=880156 RepID=UPI001562D2ED|nr:isochorismatase family cysteine hydrolase [Photorhabdus heterorhabditis]NRN27922.1 cysteine hydrolase [Photorhabdus heterorhabditis subsp. aluminescens]